MVSRRFRPLVRGFKVCWLAGWAGAVTLVLFIPITAAAVFSRSGNLAFTLSILWARFVLFISGVKASATGMDHVDRSRSHIIIANHQSLYDIPAIVTTLGIQFRWVIKKELLKIPLFGYALYASKNIFIDRSNRAQTIATLRKGIARLPRGASLIFFAEGTRSVDGRLQKFKKGGFVTAIDSGFPILPVTVNGSRAVLPKKSLAFSPGKIQVVIGEPIDSSAYTHDRVDALIERTRGVILANKTD